MTGKCFQHFCRQMTRKNPLNIENVKKGAHSPQSIKTSISSLLTLHFSLYWLVLSAVLRHLTIIINRDQGWYFGISGIQVHADPCRWSMYMGCWHVWWKCCWLTWTTSRYHLRGWLDCPHAPFYLESRHSLGWPKEERQRVAGTLACSKSFYFEIWFPNIYAFIFVSHGHMYFYHILCNISWRECLKKVVWKKTDNWH